MTTEAYLEKVAATAEAQRREYITFGNLCKNLNAFLLDDVRAALDNEARHLVGEAWVDRAKNIIASLLPAEAQASESVRLGDAVNQVQKDLELAILTNSTLISESEIREYTVEIAQHIVSNWLAMLESALEDSGGSAFHLSKEYLPRGKGIQELLAGTEGFPLNQPLLMARFCTFASKIGKNSVPIELRRGVYLSVNAKGVATLGASIEDVKEFDKVDYLKPDTAKSSAPDQVRKESQRLLELFALLNNCAHSHVGHPYPAAVEAFQAFTPPEFEAAVRVAKQLLATDPLASSRPLHYGFQKPLVDDELGKLIRDFSVIEIDGTYAIDEGTHPIPFNVEVREILGAPDSWRKYDPQSVRRAAKAAVVVCEAAKGDQQLFMEVVGAVPGGISDVLAELDSTHATGAAVRTYHNLEFPEVVADTARRLVPVYHHQDKALSDAIFDVVAVQHLARS